MIYMLAGLGVLVLTFCIAIGFSIVRAQASDLRRIREVEEAQKRSELATAVDAMNARLADIVQQIRDSSEATAKTNAESAADGIPSQRTEQAASAPQNAASPISELARNVKQTADEAVTDNQLASSAASAAQRGAQVTSGVVATMDEISQSSRKIADLIGIIDDIAFQTNILALNAAVEAARAGEQGRGFAVVASAVRTLAQRSAAAAKEIKGLVGDSVAQVESSSAIVQAASADMADVIARVRRMTDIVGEIAAASKDQKDGIAQVDFTVAELEKVTQQNAALVVEMATAAATLEEKAGRLRAAKASDLRTAH